MGGGEAPALIVEVTCAEPSLTLIPAPRGLRQKNVLPIPCTRPLQLPVTIWKRLSVLLTFAPYPFIHPLIYSANLAVQTLCWALGNAQASRPGFIPVYPLLRAFFLLSFLFI